jgi:hypothetical protein
MNEHTGIVLGREYSKPATLPISVAAGVSLTYRNSVDTGAGPVIQRAQRALDGVSKRLLCSRSGRLRRRRRFTTNYPSGSLLNDGRVLVRPLERSATFRRSGFCSC